MVKFKIDWSAEARLDLKDILDFYLKQNRTATYSVHLNSEIIKSINLISNNPLICIDTDYDSVKTFIKGDYEIIYEIIEQSVLIIMIWDCRRDPEGKIIARRIK